MSIAFVAALAACGGVDDGGTDAPDSSSETGSQGSSGSGGDGEGTTEGLIDAASTLFEAFLTRDDETYFDLLSESCRDRLGFAAVTGHLTDGTSEPVSMVLTCPPSQWQRSS